jgi:N-acetylglucosamine malate deacetylase 1
MRVLIIAPHPDDEILGVGGTIARLVQEGADVTVATVTLAAPPHFPESYVRTGREEARKAHDMLGVTRSIYLDLPAVELDTYPHHKINEALIDVLRSLIPDRVFIPFGTDLHLDHQRIFESSLVACRPGSAFTPKSILAYETLSETNWNAPYVTNGFAPNYFVDISATLELKLAALECFQSQLRPFPHERSLETTRALAMLRGATVHRNAAEAFVTIRWVE